MQMIIRLIYERRILLFERDFVYLMTDQTKFSKTWFYSAGPPLCTKTWIWDGVLSMG
jgi:hypothetical protein